MGLVKAAGINTPAVLVMWHNIPEVNSFCLLMIELF